MAPLAQLFGGGGRAVGRPFGRPQQQAWNPFGRNDQSRPTSFGRPNGRPTTLPLVSERRFAPPAGPIFHGSQTGPYRLERSVRAARKVEPSGALVVVLGAEVRDQLLTAQ